MYLIHCFNIVVRKAFLGIIFPVVGFGLMVGCASTPAADKNGDGRISNAEYQKEKKKIDAINRDIRRIEKEYGL